MGKAEQEVFDEQGPEEKAIFDFERTKATLGIFGMTVTMQVDDVKRLLEVSDGSRVVHTAITLGKLMAFTDGYKQGRSKGYVEGDRDAREDAKEDSKEPADA